MILPKGGEGKVKEIKKYYLCNYLTDVKSGYDTLEEAVKAFYASEAEGGEPIIMKPVTWKTEITDITEIT